jgi:hypothetical protein
MARRVPVPALGTIGPGRAGPCRATPAVLALATLALLAAGAPSLAAGRAAILAGYSFEDDVATGPDTFAIWRGASGHVVLSRAFHLSGGRSVELRDVAGDGDFPELQGYFAERRDGRLFFHFALLMTDPDEELNVGLAGPRFFQMERNGIAFWLATRDGWLVHVSDSIPKKLFRPEAFVWYGVDVAYAVDRGRYALRIRREGQDEPLVDLRRQPNATSRPGSAVDKFSFVGAPFSDSSNVTYFVDDVVIGADEAVLATPFAAPGRRRLFVERFLELKRRLEERPRCLPAGELADIGLVEAEVRNSHDEDLLSLLERALGGQEGRREDSLVRTGGRWRASFEAVGAWSEGCAALERGDTAAGLASFERALELVPRGRIFAVSRAMALADLGRTAEADEQLLELAAEWRDDPRYAVASAWAGIRRGDLDRAEDVLHDPALRVLDRDVNPLWEMMRTGRFTLEQLAAVRQHLQDEFRMRVEETLVTEQYYYVQLWRERYGLARDYARVMSERLARAGAPSALWVERAGDAAFLERDLALARELYEEAGQDPDRLAWAELKLADVAYLTGDLEREKALREKYYGTLRE